MSIGSVLAVTVIFLGSVERSEREFCGSIDLLLEANNKKVVAGKPVILRTTIVSQHDVPVSLRVGSSIGGVVFESGSAFHVIATSATGVAHEVRADPLVGYCATGSVPLFIRLTSSKSYTYETTAEYKVWKNGKKLFIIGGTLAFQIEPPCTVTVRLKHKASAANYTWKDYSAGRIREVTVSGPIWIGEMESNSVNLEISS